MHQPQLGIFSLTESELTYQIWILAYHFIVNFNVHDVHLFVVSCYVHALNVCHHL